MVHIDRIAIVRQAKRTNPCGDRSIEALFSRLVRILQHRQRQYAVPRGVSLDKIFRRYSLRELRAFCISVELGSFRAAAERLFVTASAVSHQVKNLESGLGIQLFDRGTRALKATTAGENLYSEIQPLIEAFDTVIGNHARTAGKQRLRISVQPFFASEWFVPRLADFRASHPDLDITVDTSDESVERHPATADVSIRIYRSPPTDLVAHRLLPLRLVPAGSPRFYDQVRVQAGKVVSDFPLILEDDEPLDQEEIDDEEGIVEFDPEYWAKILPSAGITYEF